MATDAENAAAKAAADKTTAGTTAAEKAAADKAAADKALADQKDAEKKAAERKASLEGATNMADALSRFTKGALDAMNKVPTEGAEQDLVASGVPGGKVVITGTGFSSSGTVTVNGVQVKTNDWSTTRIVGTLPPDAKSGELLVHIDDKTVRRGPLTV